MYDNTQMKIYQNILIISNTTYRTTYLVCVYDKQEKLQINKVIYLSRSAKLIIVPNQDILKHIKFNRKTKRPR
jgi:hypothetical protein